MSASRRMDLARARRSTPPAVYEGPDRLPPHSLEAEAGVLSAILLNPARGLPLARQRFGAVQPFYDLKHHAIFTAMCGLVDAQQPLDVITLHERLRDTQKLAEAGGLDYLAPLPDAIPSEVNLEAYLEIVCAKHAMRQMIAECSRTVSDAYEWQGNVDALSLRQAQRFAEIHARLHRGAAVTPSHIKTLDQFAEEVYEAFFGHQSDPEVAGWELPFHFPLRLRLGEMTFLLGEKGMGKSTLWSWLMVNCLRQGAKAFVASMEIKKRDTIKKAISQLLGRNRLADLPAEHALLRRALNYLLPRVVLFDFLGIVPWRDLLEAMKRARQELGCNLFIVDSIMRIGVHADDIAEADECSKHFGDFATSHDCHLVVVNHLNKSEGDAKKRSRGSYAWVDNSHNVVSVLRNQKKSTEIGGILSNHHAKMAGYATIQERDAKLAELSSEWDGKFYLHNQRLDGTQQNGSCALWFDFWSGQYRDQCEDPAGVCLLDRWTNNQEHREGETQ